MVSDSSTNAALRAIRAVALDVDGVLTDGGVWWGPNGEEWKRFSFSDIMGVSLARRAGLELALLSGENSQLVDRYAAKMQIRHVFKGCREKAAALREFSAASRIGLAEICYMGDDVNDLPAMKLAGFCAAPANAVPDVRSAVNFVSKCSGGSGAVRELVEAVFAARGISALDLFHKGQ